MSIRDIVNDFYVVEDAQNPVIDRAGLMARLDSHRRTVLIAMAAIFILVFVVSCGGIWLSLNGSTPGGMAAPFLGGITFLGLVEVMRRSAKEWTYLGLLIISVSVADEGQLRALIERIMDATGDERAGRKRSASRVRRRSPIED